MPILLVRQVLFGEYSTNQYSTLQDHWDLFQNAEIIISPHGAGLTNMMWARNGTSVIEFPLNPPVNHNMGMLAMMCSHDHYYLAELYSTFMGTFVVDDESVKGLVRLLAHVIEKRGLQHLLVDRDEL